MRNQWAVLLLFALSMTVSCGQKMGFQSSEVPHEKATLQDIGGSAPDPHDEPTPPPADPQTQSEDPPVPASPETNLPLAPEPPVVAAPTTPPIEPSRPAARSIVDVAKWVIQNEAKKVGAACNFFVQRVLTLLGFERANWMANDFDKYAKESFSAYNQESFVADRNGAEIQRLKKYLWSKPERTGFILQWKQARGHGHIAIVQRVQNDLVIYHAGLNTFLPKAQSITVDVLLHNRREAYALNVFSDFKK